MLIDRYEYILLLSENPNGLDLLGKVAVGLRFGDALLALQRVSVLLVASDMIALCYILPGFRHRSRAVQRLHPGIHQPPTDDRVLELHGPAERFVPFSHDIRRPRHALDATGDSEVELPGNNSTRGCPDGVGAAGAEAIDRHARRTDRQTAQQRRHTRDVAIIFSGLIGTTEKDVIDLSRIDLRIA